MVALATLTLTSFLALGCGEKATPLLKASAGPGSPATTSAAPTAAPADSEAGAASAEIASDEATAVSHTPGPSSLHERIMAEQGRTGAAPASRRTTTTASTSPQSTTTTSEAPPAEADDTTTIILSEGQTPLTGIWGGSADRLASYLLGASPSPRFTVPTEVLAEYYVSYCAEAGLRADLLWAQMIKETGYGMYGGDVVPEQNNYAGIGATGGHEPGAWFVTAEAGVMAHVAHMVAYVYPSSPVPWADSITDPRFDMVYPRGVASVLADLNGRWAVPGPSYGESIETIAHAINAY